ncbi:hypothetical protein CBS101457_003230 [Exobasidium rhododendri]|nr:hypothetical protein CBS101457_003230 [Exobasidium rhododendri]
MNMSGMSGMSGTDTDSASTACTMNMLGNWQVIGSCFLTSSWHISSTAQFAGTCVGVFLLVVLIESIRRWGREWDRYIVRKAISDDLSRKIEVAGNTRSRSQAQTVASSPEREKVNDFESQVSGIEVLPQFSSNQRSRATPAPRGAATLRKMESAFFGLPKGSPGARALSSRHSTFRPTMFQQGVRSVVYAIQFAGAYIVMLIAMSYNGYIIIAIVLGGLVGHFFSTWDTLSMQSDTDDDDTQLMGQDRSTGQRMTGARSQATYGNASGACCD